MPFKSIAQKMKFAELVREGKMSKVTYDKWDKETTDPRLPHRVEKQPRVKLAKVVK